MLKKLACLFFGHKYKCIHHNVLNYLCNPDSSYTCIVQCDSCLNGLKYYVHYGLNCGKKEFK